MEGLTLESPVLTNKKGETVLNIYNVVIETMIENANRILTAINGSEGDKTMLTAAIKTLFTA